NNGTTWTPLFDALTVNGSGEPFTLGNFSGTAPQTVNNVLTPGAGLNGTVGYEASFLFANAYQFYAFGASTEAFNSGNADQELSAVGANIAGVPARFRTSRPDLGGRWPSRLVATAAQDRLSQS